MNVIGTKLGSVSSCSEAKAGKLKFAGALEKPYGTASAHSPVALISGVLLLKEKAGTRGMQIANTSATLWMNYPDISRTIGRGREGERGGKKTHAMAKPNKNHTKIFLVQ